MKMKTNVKAGGASHQHNETLVRETTKTKGMKVKTNLQAGAPAFGNHNETLVHESPKTKGMKVKTNLKAGRLSANHNEVLVRETAKAKGVKVKTNVKAGGSDYQHNETLLRDSAKAEGVKVSPTNADELSDKDLEQVAGGIVVIGGSQATPGPEESITFVYGKLGVKY